MSLLRSHLVHLVLFSALVSAVLAVLHGSDSQGRVRFGLRIFAAFVASALIVAWLMYPFPN